MIKRVLQFGIVLLISLAGHYSFALSKGDTTTIVVLSVNDMHAKIDNFPRFQALVDDIRKENENVLIFTAGDNFTGNPIVDQYPDQGFPMIDLMNSIGFTAGAIGNHEFDYGQETQGKRFAQANFPMLSANISSADPSGLNPPAYKIFTLKNGLKVGVLGLIQVNSSGIPDTHPTKVTGVIFTDPVKKATEYRWLRDSCNIFIALTHLGYETDIELAAIFPEPDLILGGHSHTLVSNPKEFNGVLIMQAGSNLKNLGKTTLQLVDGKVVNKKGEIISVIDYPRLDSAVYKRVEAFNDNPELNRVIGTAMADINGNDELGSMITDGITAIAPLEVAFQNNGGIRIDNLNKGNITMKDIYKLDPFGNEIIQFNLSVAEIKSLILSAYKRENTLDLQVSGLQYTIIADTTNQKLDVELTMPDGSICDENRVFVAGLSSYIASSYQFDHKDPGKSLYITTAQALINLITERKEMNYAGVKRAFIKFR